MGICGSKNDSIPKPSAWEKKRADEVTRQMEEARLAEQAIHKLLLLGAGESGKSTLFKQMVTIYGKGYPEDERRSFIPIIHNNIITSMKTLCHQSDHFSPMTDGPLVASKLMVENDLRGDEEIDAVLGEHLIQLWKDPHIQATYEQRAHYQLTDSAGYFNDRLEEIISPSYIPTEQDVLRSRVRTTGIVENEFSIDNSTFKMFDVGGQRNERKKWIHCFENVTAVLFVAAISEYDQVLYEDENTNRIVEALNLFEEICNSRWFRQTSMILFLNKRDLFAEKIVKVPIAQYFPEYSGDGTYESSCQFMSDLFEAKNRNPDKGIYIHITCATDTNNISVVFKAVKDIILQKSLREVGLI